jgi:hypothetical protein
MRREDTVGFPGGQDANGGTYKQGKIWYARLGVDLRFMDGPSTRPSGPGSHTLFSTTWSAPLSIMRPYGSVSAGLIKKFVLL